MGACGSCLRRLGWRLVGREGAKWESHLAAFCGGRAQKQAWCELFLDNLELIREHTSLSKELEFEIRNTNISSEIVKIISAHYAHPQNLFRFCVELFGSYLRLKYADLVNPSRNSLLKAANEYADFQRLLIDLFVLYYALEDREIVGEELFYKSTLPALAATFLSKNEDVAATLLKLCRGVCKDQMERAQFHIQKCQQMSIDDFGASEELRLNERTLGMFQAGGAAGERPYAGAVQMVREMARVGSAGEKWQLAEGLQKQLESSVMQFYRKHGIKAEGVEISPSDLQVLLLYLVVQANQPGLLAHLTLAAHFSHSKSPRGAPTLEMLFHCF